jgi:NagD protein
MIGDTMETDIRGAVEAGLHAFLVLSGSTSLESVQDYVYQPTRILNSVADLTEEIITGRPSDRLDSPALQGGRPDQRSRFAHGPPAAAKHRPRPAMTR